MGRGRGGLALPVCSGPRAGPAAVLGSCPKAGDEYSFREKGVQLALSRGSALGPGSMWSAWRAGPLSGAAFAQGCPGALFAWWYLFLCFIQHRKEVRCLRTSQLF